MLKNGHKSFHIAEHDDQDQDQDIWMSDKAKMS